MKYVLFYQPAGDAMERMPAFFPAHSALLGQFHEQGTLLMTGPFADPVRDGSMSVFTTREAAERFMAADPFIANGLVASWRLLEWDEAFHQP